ncbi:MAG: large subunit ribosomal protein L10 [Flavobacteriales bacterium]|jgi:large subunit ribosomal protein L10
MKKENKSVVIEELAGKLTESNVFYLADTSELNAEKTSRFRRQCFKSGVELKVVKNTLLQKAMERVEGKDFTEMYDVLKGSTSVMFAEVGNLPAKLIKEFRIKNDKPVLKAAYIDEAIFIGDDQLTSLSEIKSKEELVGDIIGLLQSPAKNVISALQSGGNTIAGLVKTLQERAN